jgi:N6-adenosine-specific RNA methylase IME4
MAAGGNIPIDSIDVRGRSRKQLGNIAELAASIERIGLLHPVVVTTDNKLVVGRRRIEAFKKLGRKEIPANVAKNIDELNLLLDSERDENTCREAYTPEEAVHLGERFEDLERKAAKERQAHAGPSSGKGAKTSGSGKLPEAVKKDTRDAVGKAAGVSGKTYEKAKAVVRSGDRALIDEMNRTGKVNGAHKKLVVRQKSEAIEKEPSPVPEGPFRVIVCDPPWHYEKREADPSHRASLPYPSMSIEEIKSLPVKSRSHEDSVLWLWTTNSHIPESFAIVDAWGFKYKTLLTWGKTTMGTGDWLRGKTEHCLLCVRGKPTIRLTNQTTLLTAAKGKHSEKPQEFYDLVEALCPGSKLEMFQRKPRQGWYRIKQIWETGIDRHHYQEYRRVQELSGIPVWLLFLHQVSTPSAADRQFASCPHASPVGLFGDTLTNLIGNESHESNKHGRYGMVYWAHESLKRIATIDEVKQSALK